MAGGKFIITYDDQGALSEVRRILGALDDDVPLLRAIGEYGLQSTQGRFSSQVDPDGVAWAPLSPSYQRRKHRNADKILTLRGYLRGTLAWQLAPHAVMWGSPLRYAVAHQKGMDIQIAARSQQVFFRRNAGGEVGRLFTKKSRSNFAQHVTIAAHTIHMTQRRFLGLSTTDREEILDLAERHLLAN